MVKNWQVVAMLHNGTVRVVSEHQHEKVAEAVEMLLDGLLVLTGRENAGFHYDVRQTPATEPGAGLAGLCEHGEQMLNACVACEVDHLRSRVVQLEELKEIVMQIQGAHSGHLVDSASLHREDPVDDEAERRLRIRGSQQ